MITYFQSVIIGLLQGFAELFPISSLGHSVILPKLVGWNINQNDSFFLTFLVATHFATALVLFLFFFKDWCNIFKGIARSLAQREISASNYYGKLGWLLVAGTIPTGILGLLFEEQLRSLFASARSAAFFLILNGALLYGAEWLRKRTKENLADEQSDLRMSKISWSQSIKIGLAQIIALIPGFSRSGATIGGGLLVGLSHEDAARFSFLLATPIIGAAALLKLPELFAASNHNLVGPAIIGAGCAAITTYLSVKFLVKYFHTNKLTPFATYCVAAGVIYSLLLYFKF